MTTYAATQTKPSAPQVGERVELARYHTSSGERILYGQRIDGVVRVTDVPASGHGRAYLVERELEQDGNAALNALVADYVHQARRLDAISMSTRALAEMLGS
jgi:hypothetical protein